MSRDDGSREELKNGLIRHYKITAGELRGMHGVACEFMTDTGVLVTHGVISVHEGTVHICHNNSEADGSDAEDKMGRTFSWIIYHRYEDDSHYLNKNYEYIDVVDPHYKDDGECPEGDGESSKDKCSERECERGCSSCKMEDDQSSVVDGVKLTSGEVIKRGDMVYVSDNSVENAMENKLKKVYVGYIHRSSHPHIATSHVDEFLSGEEFSCSLWRYAVPVPERKEMTVTLNLTDEEYKEIKDKYNVVE